MSHDPVWRQLQVRPAGGLPRLVLAVLVGAFFSVLLPGGPLLAGLVLGGGVLATALAWWLGRANLSRLSVAAPRPATAFAWEAAPVRFELTNLSPRLAAYDLLLFHSMKPEGSGRLFCQLCELRPNRFRRLSAPMRLPRRGRYSRYYLNVVSTFPFGLFEWGLRLAMPADLTALPRLGALQEESEWLSLPERAAGERPRGSTGDEEFHSLKDWRPGMSPRRISWKASARLRRWVVRECGGESPPDYHIVLSSFGVADRSARHDPAFERAVALSATLVEHLLRRRARVRFSFHGPEGFTLRPTPGRAGLMAVLDALVPVQRSTAKEQPWRRPSRRQGETTLMVLAGGGARTLRFGSQGQSLRVIDVDLPEVEKWFRLTRRDLPRFFGGGRR